MTSFFFKKRGHRGNVVKTQGFLWAAHTCVPLPHLTPLAWPSRGEWKGAQSLPWAAVQRAPNSVRLCPCSHSKAFPPPALSRAWLLSQSLPPTYNFNSWGLRAVSGCPGERSLASPHWKQRIVNHKIKTQPQKDTLGSNIYPGFAFPCKR